MIVKHLVALLGFQTDENSAKKAEASIQNLVQLAKVAATTFATIKVFSVAKQTAEQVAMLGDQFDEMAQRTGASAQALQAWSYVAAASGGSAQDLETGLKYLARTSYEAAKGSKEATEAYKVLGVTVKNADGSMKTAEQLLPEVAEGLRNAKSESERTALAMKVLGRSGTRLLPMLKGGSKALADQVQVAYDLGAVMDEDLIRASAEWDDAQNQVKMGAQGLRNIIGKALIPTLTGVARATVGWIKANRKWIESNIAPVIKRVGEGVARLRRAVGDAAAGFMNWLSSLDPLQKKFMAIGLTAAAIAALLALPGGVILLLIGLIALLIDDFQAWREGGESVIGDLVAAFKELIDFVPGLGVAIKVVGGILQGAFAVMRDAVFAFFKFFVDWWEVGLIEACWRAGQSIINIFKLIWSGIGEHVMAALAFWADLIKGFLSTIWGLITGAVKAIGSAIAAVFMYAYDSVAMVLTSIYNAIVNAFTTAASAVWSVMTGAWNTLVAGWQAFSGAVVSVVSTLWNGVLAGFKWLWDSLVAMVQFYIDLILAPFRGMMALWNALWTDGLDGVLKLLKSWAEAAIDLVLAPFKKVKEWIGKLFGGGKAAELEVGITRTEKTGPAAPAPYQAPFPAPSMVWPSMPGVATTPAQQAPPAIARGAVMMRGLANVAQAGPAAFAPAYAQAPVARGPISIAPQTKVDVQVTATPGMNEAQLAQQVAKQVEVAIENQNRLAIQALTPAAAAAR